jgi:hypothetical protein
MIIGKVIYKESQKIAKILEIDLFPFVALAMT